MSAELSLYLHSPFCRSKCPYCDFYSGAAETLGVCESAYFGAMARELELRLTVSPSLRGRKLRSLYFGGGTPGMNDPELFEPLIEKIHAAFTAVEQAETTLELNPGSSDRDSLSRFIGLGVNRFSIGVQSFNDRLLRSLGRTHDVADTRRLLDYLQQCGATPRQISLDLIFAVPGESLDEWRADLDEALALRCGHISLYGLTFYEDTPFAEQRAAGQLAEADEETQVAMYRLAREKLADAGYQHYEISNFARPGRRSVHNSIYWTEGEYLGLGAAAHSFLDGGRFHNLPDASEYVRAVGRRKLFAQAEPPLSERTRLGERMMLGLRLIEGLAIVEFNRRYSVDMEDYYRQEITQLVKDDLLQLGDGRLRLTDRGLLLADRVMAEFF
jgi:oxygen-independent coproporphyrinogen-3 oxidase